MFDISDRHDDKAIEEQTKHDEGDIAKWKEISRMVSTKAECDTQEHIRNQETQACDSCEEEIHKPSSWKSPEQEHKIGENDKCGCLFVECEQKDDSPEKRIMPDAIQFVEQDIRCDHKEKHIETIAWHEEDVGDGKKTDDEHASQKRIAFIKPVSEEEIEYT